MSDRRETQANLRQQIIGILYERAGTHEYTLAQQADEILSLVKGNEPPGGWFHFGSHVDWAGQLEFSEEVGEDGLPLWERPLPLTENETVESWAPAGRGWREMQQGESAGGREFITHGWLARPIDSFHKVRTWVQDVDRPTEWSRERDDLVEDMQFAEIVRKRSSTNVQSLSEVADQLGTDLDADGSGRV